MNDLLDFVPLDPENREDCLTFENLMRQYIRELDEHSGEPMPPAFLEKWLKSIPAMLGPADRHLELCYAEGALIGFLYGKIDHEDHRGFIKPGYGYIMEFFVRPEYRRRGYGRAMYRRLEDHFRRDGASRMYLTADPVTGKPFWEALGFVSTGERSPENQEDMYEKAMP